MATVVRFPRRPPKFEGVGKLAGLFLGKNLADAKKREKSKEAIEAYESVFGEQFSDEEEETLVERGTTMDDLVSFAAEQRARAEEQRRERAFPLQQEQRREGIESSEQQQRLRRMREQRQQKAFSLKQEQREESLESTRQQQKLRESREERAGKKAERQARQSRDVEVTLVNEDTNETRPAIIDRAVLRGEKELPKDLKDAGWSLTQSAEEGKSVLSGTEDERALRDFILTMGGDPGDPRDREAGRRAFEGKDNAIKIIKEAFGEKSGDVFTFGGKRKDLFTTATGLVERIIWNSHQQGKRINVEQAANIAIKRAEQIHGGLEEERPEAQVQSLREKVSTREEAREQQEERARAPITGAFFDRPEERQDPIARVNTEVNGASSAQQERLASLLAANRVNPAIEILTKELGVDKASAQDWVLAQINEGEE